MIVYVEGIHQNDFLTLTLGEYFAIKRLVISNAALIVQTKV